MGEGAGMNPTSLTEFNTHVHAHLDELLLQHLEALTALDLDAARATWQQLVQILEAHTDAEDATALRVYQQLGDFPDGGKPAMFDAEHQSLHKLIRLLTEDLSRLSPSDPLLRRKMVLTLRRYTTFRDLFEHHTLREQNLLYPILEAQTHEQTQAVLRDALQKAFDCQQISVAD
jgi:hemerythrin-like domain-containing protein